MLMLSFTWKHSCVWVERSRHNIDTYVTKLSHCETVLYMFFSIYNMKKNIMFVVENILQFALRMDRNRTAKIALLKRKTEKKS